MPDRVSALVHAESAVGTGGESHRHATSTEVKLKFHGSSFLVVLAA